MASFHGARFPGPKYNQNVLRSNININPAIDRHPGPSFQRPLSAPYRPIQPPERFMHGNFQNRPQFANFPEASVCDFRNRVPPPNQIFRFNSPPPTHVLPNNSPPNQVFHMNPPNQVFRMSSPTPNQPFNLKSSPSDQVFRMNAPPNQVFRMNAPPNQVFHMNPPNQIFRMSSPTPNQPFNVKSPPSDQVFRMQSPPPVPRPCFSGHFERPFRTWNQTSFGVPNSPFESRPRVPQPYQRKYQPLQSDKKKKQKTREFRKLKEDTTEKPFSCDTCDRAFMTENELTDHLSLHIKCDHGNCMFEAHPKIVALHQKMQHDTGYADRINKLQDDAEIKKWREERKRRFPTAENIRKRKAEQAEKEARGEVLETKEFGKFKRRREEATDVVNNDTGRRMQNHPYRRRNRRRNFQNHRYSQPCTVTIDSESDSDSDSHITLNEFSGMSSLKNSASEMNSQNEDNISSCEKNLSEFDSDHNVSCPEILHADDNLSNGKTDQTSFLLNDDNIQDLPAPADESVCIIPSSEIDLVKPEVVDLEDLPAPADESVCTIPSKEIDSVEPEVIDLGDSEDEGPVVAPIMKSEKAITDYGQGFETTGIQHHNVNEFKKETELKLKDDKSNNGPKRDYSSLNGLSNRQGHTFQARKSTLLEKLLADDIRHERNVILQCIRHIVNNNFFGIGSKN